MHLNLDTADLLPVVQQALLELHEQLALFPNKLAFSEAEAAEATGLKPHNIRDARLRGLLVGSKVGKKIVYERDQLLGLLARQRIESRAPRANGDGRNRGRSNRNESSDR